MSVPRLRFAPSPTGYLHVGGARTALFNWLFARKAGGVFILRIEDTDAERSSWEMTTGILDALKWLGLDWDEGPDVGGPHAPYFQSERLDRYRAMAERLVREGRAYYCYCRPEDLQAERDAAQARGEAWNYDRRCAALPEAEIARREADGRPRAVRFRTPPGATSFRDLVHGEVSFDNAVIEDFVVLRSDGHPTYHLSVVADDIDMSITHVVRGDDHVSNTPKQVLLYGAVGAAPPVFAHAPLILGPDKKRLSKRHGATSVMEYERAGYLPEAMVNFLALLGWSPGDDREVFTRDELIDAFALEGIGGGAAVFNPEKLEWFNQQHIARLDDVELRARVRPLVEAAGLWSEDLDGPRAEWFRQALALYRPRARRLSDFVQGVRVFRADLGDYDPVAVQKHLSQPGLAEPLAAWRRELARVAPFDQTSLEAALRATAAAHNVKAAALIHATRIALTGQAVSPGLFDVMVLAGRELAVRRLERLETFLSTRTAPNA
jgi:glutamyl-tRNA synthetase